MSDYCVCNYCGCKHLVWEKSCPYCRRIKELDKELDIASNTIAKLEKQVAEHEYRWKWLNRSILALSKEGYTEWASGVLAVINKCRYEEVDDE